MINVTDNAKKHLQIVLAKKSKDPDACLRLATKEDGKLKLSVDVERPGDQVIKENGSKILAFTKVIAMRLEKKTIDVRTTDDGPKIVVLSRKA